MKSVVLFRDLIVFVGFSSFQKLQFKVLNIFFRVNYMCPVETLKHRQFLGDQASSFLSFAAPDDVGRSLFPYLCCLIFKVSPDASLIYTLYCVVKISVGLEPC